MNAWRRTTTAILLALLLGTTLHAQDAGASRELAGIAEEQALLQRQLKRLESTMEVLLQRIDAEGRVRTVELLRDALEVIDARTAPAGADAPLTMEERMDQSRSALEGGQLVQSLASQQALIAEMGRLLSILLDRKNLEALEEKIAELRELQASVDALADREQTLRGETQELRENASNEAQKALEQSLAELYERERSLLRRNETLGRESGTLELEQLERELARLLRDQETDAEVLEAWDPSESARLEAVRTAVARALRAEARGARLDEAARELEGAAAATAPEVSATERERARERIAAAAEQARRHESSSGDPAAARAARELEAAEEALRRTAEGEITPAEAERELRAGSEGLTAAAEAAREPATAARAEAQAGLEELAETDTPTGQAAEEMRELLAEAARAASEGDKTDARNATEEAARALEQTRQDLSTLGEALSSSQADQAERTERVERGLDTLPQAETEAGAQAEESLQRAAEAMRAASQSARQSDSQAAARSAREAAEELGRALQSLSNSRREAGQAQARASQELAREQGQGAQEAAQLGQDLGQASMSPEAQEAVREALERAAEAMKQAQEELAEGRSASAAGSQRQAMQELREAMRASSEGVTPNDPADRERAEELAREQEQIREDLLDLARRIEERENARPLPGLDRAQAEAQEATQELRGGDLSQAEESEREVEQELRQTREQLEEEEEQYQRLREEEALFRIAEEIQSLLEGHREQMGALLELDGQRQPNSAPSRAQKLRLRRIAREEEALGTRALEISGAVAGEGALVAGQLLENVASDLERISENLSEVGDYDTGGRTQALQRDIEESLIWLLEALQQEQARRREEGSQQQQEEQGQEQQKPGLVPDTAELKLLRHMEIDLQQSVDELLLLYPELEDPDEIPDYVLRDIARLGIRHEKITSLFRAMRARLGLEAPEDVED